jgi:hypothetical protein
MDSPFVPSEEADIKSFLSFSSYLQSTTEAICLPDSTSGDAKSCNLMVSDDSCESEEPSLVRTPVVLLSALSSYVESIVSSSSLDHALLGATGDFVEEPVVGWVDSGANCHILTYEDALKLLADMSESNLRVLGVNGSTTRAVVKGQLFVDLVGSSGRKYLLDLGTAHGMKDCPMNLLSLSLLLDVGAVLHFEQGNCWIKPPGSAEHISLKRVGGLFQVPLSKISDPDKMGVLKLDEASGEFVREAYVGLNHDDPIASNFFSCDLIGQSFLSGDLDLWHRRMRHISKQTLKTISTLGLVAGFNLTGNTNAQCGCDTCTQAKIKRDRNERQRHYKQRCTSIGHHVSSDIKSLPYESFEGYKYAICFVDHYSRLGICYMMRTKDEAVEKFMLFQKELEFYGYRVHHLHSDRGSEYFSQEGELLADRDRSLSALDEFCASLSPMIKHTVTPVEAKEKIAEAWFKDHFDTADAMLFDARLSPAFWADAIMYSQYLYNRMPNSHTGPSTPYQMLTGDRARWDKIRVFGCDAFMLIPNDALAKVPGVVKGRKVIFVGFSLTCNGYRVFDPESRRYSTVNNIVFYESFKHRVDALRHHDKRRKLLKKGVAQPVQLNDFEDENANGVRNLYLDPDPVEVAPKERDFLDPDPVSQDTPKPKVPNKRADGGLEMEPDTGSTSDATPELDTRKGPLSTRALDSARARNVLRSAEMLRPLRLLPVSKEAKWTKEDADFLEHARTHDLPVAFVSNPKRRGTPSFLRYLKYSPATTLREAVELGASMDDIRWDYRRAFIRFPKHESDLPGHIYNAVQTAEEYGHTHILDDVGHFVTPTDYADHMLARAFGSVGLERAKVVFNDAIRTVYDPTLLPAMIETRMSALKFAEHQFAKVLNAKVDVNIDWSLAPEPVRWEQTLPEVCSESEK